MSTDWIQPGAPIAVYSNDWRGEPRQLFTTTVKKVAKRSFTVVNMSERFNLETLHTKDVGASLTPSGYIATHPDSDDATRVKERNRWNRAKDKVWRYLHNDAESLEQVDAAIQALTEWRTLLAPEGPQ